MIGLRLVGCPDIRWEQHDAGERACGDVGSPPRSDAHVGRSCVTLRVVPATLGGTTQGAWTESTAEENHD